MGRLFRILLLYLQYEKVLTIKIWIMKWNDVELVDGKFYFIEVERWRNGEPNHWVFAYKDNNDLITNHHVSAKITDTDNGVCNIYDFGHVCFWDYLDRWGYKYNINTKKLRHVGDR